MMGVQRTGEVQRLPGLAAADLVRCLSSPGLGVLPSRYVRVCVRRGSRGVGSRPGPQAPYLTEDTLARWRARQLSVCRSFKGSWVPGCRSLRPWVDYIPRPSTVTGASRPTRMEQVMLALVRSTTKKRHREELSAPARSGNIHYTE